MTQIMNIFIIQNNKSQIIFKVKVSLSTFENTPLNIAPSV